MESSMNITDLFNFDGSVNRVSRTLIYFMQRINDDLNYKFINASDNTILDDGRVGDYLDAPAYDDAYDEWDVSEVYFDGTTISLYITDNR